MNSCSPGKGRTYLTIGQDLFSIEEYVTSQYNYSLHEHDDTKNSFIEPMSSFAPAAGMFYTDLDKLRGLKSPVDYGSGIEFANGIRNSLFPSTDVGLQIGLWLDGSDGCEKILNDEMEEQLLKLCDYLETNRFTAIFLRIGYEFDNPSFGYSNDPQVYATAFQFIVRFIRNNVSHESLIKTKFVWHSWAAPRKEGVSLEDFYPGDTFVDWVGVSVFQQVFPWSSSYENGYVNWGGDESDVEEVLRFAKAHGKPTMIAESTPFGGINLNNTNTRIFNDTDAWDRWFGRVLALIEMHDIDMWSYINCDWDSQPMWKNIGFGDTRLSSNDHVMKQWRHYIIESRGKQTFLMGNTMECGISEEHRMEEGLDSHYSIRNPYSFVDALSLSFLVFCIYLLFFLLRYFVQSYYNNREMGRQSTKNNLGTTQEYQPILQKLNIVEHNEFNSFRGNQVAYL